MSWLALRSSPTPETHSGDDRVFEVDFVFCKRRFVLRRALYVRNPARSFTGFVIADMTLIFTAGLPPVRRFFLTTESPWPGSSV
jgi:hypothetical protein